MIKRSLLQIVPISPLADSPLQPSPQLSPNTHIAITRDGFGLAEVLAQKLNNLGYQAELTQTLPTRCDIAVILDAFQHFTTQESAIAINEKIFTQVQQIAEHFSANGGRLIAVEDTGGKFATSSTALHAPWAAGVSGLIKTAAQEWPKAVCKVVDLQHADQTLEKLAERLLPEILNGAEREIGLLADGRCVMVDLLEAKAKSRVDKGAIALCPPKQSADGHVTFCPSYKSELQENDIVLVTGGARGVTAACLIEWAKHIPLRFVLFGRTALSQAPEYCQHAQTETELKQAIFSYHQQQNISITPKEIQTQIATILGNREIAHTIKTLEELGSTVLYIPVDVLKQTVLEKTVEDIRKQWGNISAVVHGAGVLADKLITQKTLEQFLRVFNTKVLGLKNILAVTKPDTLKLLVLFSSVAGRFGNPGQCDYAMANEILNKVAQQYQRQHKNCVVKSINWGPWESGMVTPQLKQLFEQRGVALLPVDLGTKIFVDEITSHDGQVEIVIGGTLVPEADWPKHSQFTVSAQTHPYLASHLVKDVIVLPACLALEWFVQAAKKYLSTTNGIVIKNFRVLRGIQLPNFDQPLSFAVVVSENPLDKNVLQLKLMSDAPMPHYSAEITTETLSPAAPQPQHDMHAWPYGLNKIYSEILFHGKDFYAITQLDKISDHSATANIQGTKRLSWPGIWQIDALAFDAVFQLGILWGVHMTGKQNLPSACAEIRIYELSCPEDQFLYCNLFNAQIKGNRVVYDATLQHADGRIYAMLIGAEGVCYDV